MARKVRRERRRNAVNYIREWRKHRGLSQEALAERTGLSDSTISELERAEVGYSAASLEAIAEALDCSAADLLFGPPVATLMDLRDAYEALEPNARQRAIEILALLRSTDQS